MRRHIYYTLQSLLHKQGSNAIKIVSLALGLLMSVFLFARIAFELSFDNFYHDSDNLYIVKTGWLKNGVLEGNESRFTIIPIPAAIAEEFPEQVESSTVSCSLFDNSFQLGERQLDMSTVMADTLYFSVLGLEMIEGNPQDLAYPGILGDKAPTANVGSFKANGWEGTLNWSDKIGKVSYHVGGTFTYTTNELTDNGGSATIKDGVRSDREGYPLNSVFGLRYCGKIQTQEELDKYMNRYGENNSIDMPAMLRLGDNMFEDVNRDGKLTEEDFVYLGTDDPKISFSFNAGLEWSGFDVSVIFQGVGRRTVWRDGDNSSNVNWRVPMRSVYMNTTNQSVGNVWSPENPNAHYPTYTNTSQINNYNYRCSSWSVEDGSYLRLKNITLGYTLPSALLAKTKVLSYARLYISGADLWETSKINDGWDPEASRKVSTYGRYPFTRNVTVGLNLTF